MAGYSAANLDDIVAEKWPYWAPIRYHFDIRSFGASAWRGAPGDEVIKAHNEGPGGHEELYMVLSGHATFTVAGDEIDAPTGMCIHIADPTLERSAVATEAGTVVLSLGGWPDKQFEPSEWELASFAE
jgi:quercetin dioxygenase-like cupin family protein